MRGEFKLHERIHSVSLTLRTRWSDLKFPLVYRSQFPFLISLVDGNDARYLSDERNMHVEYAK